MKILARQAIRAALEKDWIKAEKLNLEILTQEPSDVSSLNRLSLAQANLGKIRVAQKSLKAALSHDPSNPIALKNLNRLKTVKKAKTASKNTSSLTANVFLKEAGKTKTVALIKPAGPQVLNTLSVGENLTLDPKKKTLQVKRGKFYLGSLPNLLAFRLQKLLKKGYRYQVYFWRTESETISVFIKEVFRPKKMAGLPSFV